MVVLGVDDAYHEDFKIKQRYQPKSSTATTTTQQRVMTEILQNQKRLFNKANSVAG
jgi:hypothetical protein